MTGSTSNSRPRELPPYRAVLVADLKGFSDNCPADHAELVPAVAQVLERAFTSEFVPIPIRVQECLAPDGPVSAATPEPAPGVAGAGNSIGSLDAEGGEVGFGSTVQQTRGDGNIVVGGDLSGGVRQRPRLRAPR